MLNATAELTALRQRKATLRRQRYRFSKFARYRAERFAGREGVTYTVEGKGGLVREVQLPRALADRLEAQWLDTPRSMTDRGITYEQHYNLG